MNKKIRHIQFLGIFTLGLITSSLGALTPVIQSDLRLSYAQAGLILSSQFFGSLFSIIIGGYAADRVGKKNFLIAGGVFIFCGMTGVMLSNSFNPLYMFAVISGVGFGAFNVGINALCMDYTVHNKGNAMNMLHGFYGIGAILGPIISTTILMMYHTWRPIFGMIAISSIIVCLLLIVLKLPKANAEKEKKTGNPYKNWFIWIAGMVAFIYIGAESTLSGWFPALWVKMNTLKLIPASLIPAIFWAAITLGRLISGSIADRMGLPKFITILTSITLVLGLGLWLFAGWPMATLAVVFLIGSVLGGIFPTLMASTASHYLERTGEVSAFLALFLSIGGFVIPIGTGKAADIFGITIIPIVFLGLALLLSIFAIVWRLLEGSSTPVSSAKTKIKVIVI